MRYRQNPRNNDNSGNGNSNVVESYIAGESISALKVVYFDNGKVFVLDNTVDNHLLKILGVSITTGTLDSSIDIVTLGSVEDSFFNFPEGSQLFCNNLGSIVSTIPSGNVVEVGRAIKNNKILVDFSNIILRD